MSSLVKNTKSVTKILLTNQGVKELLEKAIEGDPTHALDRMGIHCYNSFRN